MEFKAYFQKYGEAFRDAERLADFYGDCAMASTPSFVGCLKDRGEVRAALVNVAEGQVRTGMQSLIPQHLEVTPVDSLHWWVKVQWDAKFKKTKSHVVSFEISYLLRSSDDRFIILLYVDHQDEQKMRKELELT